MSIFTDLEGFNVKSNSTFDKNIGQGNQTVRDMLANGAESLTTYHKEHDAWYDFAGHDVADTVFAGLDKNNFERLTGPNGAIEQYCQALDSIVADFNANKVDAGSAFRGDIKTQIEEFVEGAKELIYAYISNLRQFRKEADNYMQKYVASIDLNSESEKPVEMSIAEDIQKGVQEITQNAQSIKFDELDSGGQN